MTQTRGGTGPGAAARGGKGPGAAARSGTKLGGAARGGTRPGAAARSGKGPAAARCGAALLAAAVLLLPVERAAAAGAGAAPERAGGVLRTAELTKFYVVRAPEENGGKVDGLQDIAGRVLGDPDRFQEILVLNTGRVLPGGDVFVSAEQLVPGFALRLPTDAEGPGVQFGELPEEAPGAGQRSSAAAQPPSANRSGGPFGGGGKVPVGLVAGGVAGVAALTVAVLARRPLTRWLRALGRAAARGARVLRPRLPRPLAVALRRRRRSRLARRLAADTRTPVIVRSALDELVRAGGPEAPMRVYSVRADGEGLLASVSGGTRAPAPWTAHAPHDWRRTGLPSAPGCEPRREGPGGSATRATALEVRGAVAEYRPEPAPGDSDPAEARRLTLPHLARVGVDARDAQVMVGLGQLNGALSVRGDLRVARDTLTALAHGLLELPWQNTVVVAVDPDPDSLPGLHGLVRVRSLAEVEDRAPARVFEAAEALGLGLVRAPARPDRITGFLLMMRPPRDSAEARALAGLAAPEGGWSVLSVGDVPGAHWRWHAEPEGTVDLGVLGLRVTVPTAPALTADRV
ncbi:hypothetical protein AB0O01_31985 [Streptomyces sp. NPDC093252]|uniref:hypothetical protein n=1 Tax=Streptomyces sp. NPDC093252 TaxID=3154980 RepID=UPI00343A245D